MSHISQNNQVMDLSFKYVVDTVIIERYVKRF